MSLLLVPPWMDRFFKAVPWLLLGVAIAGVVALRDEQLVDRWVEHCVNQYRPKYQEGARVKCAEEAERWRYGDEAPTDWTEFDEAMDAHFKLLASLPECVESDRALERCNEAAALAGDEGD